MNHYSRYLKAVWLKISPDSIGTLFYKTHFKENEFKSVDLKRFKRKPINIDVNIKPVRRSLRPISTLKNENLQTLIKWVPPLIFHQFYKDLPYS